MKFFNYVQKAMARKDMSTDGRPTSVKEAAFKLAPPDSQNTAIPKAPPTQDTEDHGTLYSVISVQQ